MADIETKMGGSGEAFPETLWSTVLSSPDSPERRAHLDQLFRTYWRPVYKFVRAAWGRTVEDAKDLTQAFFVHLLESDVVARYQPRQGRFRHFLKAVLRNFLAEAQRDSHRLKRGGGRTFLSLEVGAIETAGFQSDLQRCSPEEIFDRQWVRDVITQSMAKAKEALEKEGKLDYYRAYEAYEVRGEKTTYEKVGRELGISAADVKNRLEYVRARLRQAVMDQVSVYVSSREDLLAEMNELFSG